MAEGKQRSPDLTFATLDQGQGERRAIAPRLVPTAADPGARRGLPALEPHARLEPTRRRVAEPPLHGHAIDARALAGRVQQRLGEFAVVGQQQEPFAFAIEPAHREDPRLSLGNQVHHRRTALGVAHGGEHPTRLVQDPVGRRLRRDRTAIQGDAILVGIGSVSERRNAAVHRDPPVPNEELATSARAHAGRSQDLLESFANGCLQPVRGA